MFPQYAWMYVSGIGMVLVFICYAIIEHGGYDNDRGIPVISEEDGVDGVGGVVSDFPSLVPSDVPSIAPSDMPSWVPSDVPSSVPSDLPSFVPSDMPSSIPSDVPSSTPSDVPSSTPSDVPSKSPSDIPTSSPTGMPTMSPTSSPTETPTVSPTALPQSDYPSLVPVEWTDEGRTVGEEIDPCPCFEVADLNAIKVPETAEMRITYGYCFPEEQVLRIADRHRAYFLDDGAMTCGVEVEIGNGQYREEIMPMSEATLEACANLIVLRCKQTGFDITF